MIRSVKLHGGSIDERVEHCAKGTGSDGVTKKVPFDQMDTADLRVRFALRTRDWNSLVDCYVIVIWIM